MVFFYLVWILDPLQPDRNPAQPDPQPFERDMCAVAQHYWKKCIFHMPVKLFMVAYPHFVVMNDGPRYFDTPIFFVIIYF